MLYRVFEETDGQLRIVKPNPRLRRPNETDQEMLDRTAAKAVDNDPSLAELPFTDLDERELPANRVQRNKWRRRGASIVVDGAVPDPPHKKQALLDAIAQANDLTTLKQELTNAIRAGKL